MLDHIGLNVSDYARSRDFYAQAPLSRRSATGLLEPRLCISVHYA